MLLELSDASGHAARAFPPRRGARQVIRADARLRPSRLAAAGTAVGIGTVMHTAADRLHYTSAAFTVGPFYVLAAVLLREGMTTAG